MTDINFRFFDAADYTVFCLLLFASASIGIYFGFLNRRKQNTTSEYLLGSKEMSVFPIAMSIVATHFSGITLFGYPAEIYTYGTQVWVELLPEIILTLIMVFWFIPVFYRLDITSMYEYLNKRFNFSVRTVGSILFIGKMILLIPVGVYGPTLALSQVSGFPVEILIPVTCFVCIFYTTIGGIKAVVWTDTLQILIIVLGVVIVLILGTVNVGGVKAVFDISQRGHRIDFFNMSWDPTIRHTFWNVIIGKSFYRLGFFIMDQGTIQRCLSTPTLRKAQMSMAVFSLGLTTLAHITMYFGLLIYAAFYNCDPVTAGLVRKADQILPLFVMKTTGHIPALPGIFLCAIFSATLSTMSTGLNSMSCVIYKDFIEPLHKKPIEEARASHYMKITTIILGVICTGFTFMVEHLSGVYQGAASVGATSIGALFGIYCLGMFFPWANSKGALVGGASAATLVGWMAFGSQSALHARSLVYANKPVTIQGCDNATLHSYQSRLGLMENVTDIAASDIIDTPFILYKISYTWYTLIGVVTVLVVGMLVSWATGPNDPCDMNPYLFSPAIQTFLNRRNRSETEQVSPKSKEQTTPLMTIY